jgi:hypothetical protein
VAVIQRGAVSFGEKAELAMAAGAIGVIFVNDDSEMVAPQLEEWRDLASFASVPSICLTKSDGDQLSALLRSHEEACGLHAGGGYGQGVSQHVHVRWWDLTAGWAARRIQKQWRHRVESRRQAIH